MRGHHGKEGFDHNGVAVEGWGPRAGCVGKGSRLVSVSVFGLRGRGWDWMVCGACSGADVLDVHGQQGHWRVWGAMR